MMEMGKRIWRWGAFFADFNGTNSGSVYVKFGNTQTNLTSTQNRPLSTAANYDIRYDGDIGGGSSPILGGSVAFGDFDGDGKADLAMGAIQADFNGTDSGSVYVKFGDTQANLTLDQNKTLDATTNYDIRYDGDLGGGSTPELGQSVGFGDYDGDGKADLAMTARLADYNGVNSGSMYVKFGDTQANLTLDQNKTLDATTNYDIRYDGDPEGGTLPEFGQSVGFGDFDGDGKAELAMGAKSVDFNGSNSGSVYVVQYDFFDSRHLI